MGTDVFLKHSFTVKKTQSTSLEVYTLYTISFEILFYPK